MSGISKKTFKTFIDKYKDDRERAVADIYDLKMKTDSLKTKFTIEETSNKVRYQELKILRGDVGLMNDRVFLYLYILGTILAVCIVSFTIVAYSMNNKIKTLDRSDSTLESTMITTSEDIETLELEIRDLKKQIKDLENKR